MCFPFFQRAGNIALAMGFELHDSQESTNYRSLTGDKDASTVTRMTLFGDRSCQGALILTDLRSKRDR
jgi:hypothetical protein